MVRVRVKFTYPTDKITVPVIDTMSKRFSIVSNIRRANVQDHSGWVVLQLGGEESDIKAGLEWVREQGVHVDPVEGDNVH